MKVKSSDVLKIVCCTKYGHYEFFIVLFGPTNVLVAFINSMDQRSNDYLDEFVMVLIGDIFMFSKSCEWLE